MCVCVYIYIYIYVYTHTTDRIFYATCKYWDTWIMTPLSVICYFQYQDNTLAKHMCSKCCLSIAMGCFSSCSCVMMSTLITWLCYV